MFTKRRNQRKNLRDSNPEINPNIIGYFKSIRLKIVYCILLYLLYIVFYLLTDKKVQTIGGQTAEKHLTNCLVTTLTNKLAKELTWDGQRQTEGIKNTIFSNLIIGKLICFN